MTSPLLMSRETDTVRCPECGDSREVSVRQRRRLANEAGDYRCSLCRTVLPVEINSAHLNYWTKRYSPEWIEETAAMIWGGE